MSKVIKAVFTGRFCRTQRVFQFDTDDKLQFVNVDLPANFTVDFSNSKTGDSVSVLATSDTVQIPPDLFVPGSEIYAWIWLSDSNGGHTRCEATIPIDPRARRTGTEPTPAQASAWDEAVDTLNETIEGIPAVVNAALTKAKESGEFDGEDGADGSNAWLVDVQYTDTAGTTIRALTEHLIGPPNAMPMYGDVLFVSDGRFGNIIIPGTRITIVSTLGDLPGEPGADGYSPVVTITEIDGGHRVTITDETHPQGQSFDVMDGQGGSETVDDDFSTTSENPVQNKVISNAVATMRGQMIELGNALATKYTKPSGGIPKADLAAAVQTSLGKADAAIPAPASPSSAQDLVYLNGAWVAADKLYIVNCTPTELDFSGTMDKTVAEIYAAYQAGKSIVFRLWTAVDSHFDTVGTMFWTSGDRAYPSFNAFVVVSDSYDAIVFAYTGATNNGATATYGTSIYPLSTSACIPAPSSPSTGDFLCWNGSSWAATSLSTWQGGNY